jgi:hypothetical protein
MPSWRVTAAYLLDFSDFESMHAPEHVVPSFSVGVYELFDLRIALVDVWEMRAVTDSILLP